VPSPELAWTDDPEFLDGMLSRSFEVFVARDKLTELLSPLRRL